MPELPEVETVRRGLSDLIVGKTIKSVWFDWPKSFPNVKNDVDEFVIGAKVVSVTRRAKILLIELSSKYTLLTHLKMTGQLVFKGAKKFGAGHPNDSLVGDLPDKSTRVILDLGDSKLYFNDQRKFGWMRLFPTTEIANIDFMKKLGPEPLSSRFTAKEFRERLNRRGSSSTKAVLLDQTVIAGVGNIYADESLWAAKIYPSNLVKNVSTAKLNTLFIELIKILKLGIEKGGSTDKNYVNAEGKKGSYLSFAKVFRREGLGCPRCGRTIQKTRVAGRGTHYCPYCQKPTRSKK